ncbi:MAG: hypothetical protein V3V14_01230 [Saprospiraceae bacterium]
MWHILWHRYFGTDILGWDILAQIFLKIFYLAQIFLLSHRKKISPRRDIAKSEICHRGLVLECVSDVRKCQVIFILTDWYVKIGIKISGMAAKLV